MKAYKDCKNVSYNDLIDIGNEISPLIVKPFIDKGWIFNKNDNYRTRSFNDHLKDYNISFNNYDNMGE